LQKQKRGPQTTFNKPSNKKPSPSPIFVLVDNNFLIPDFFPSTFVFSHKEALGGMRNKEDYTTKTYCCEGKTQLKKAA
jgi:hypothetical protein